MPSVAGSRSVTAHLRPRRSRDRSGRIVKRYPGYFPGQEEELRAIVSGILMQEEAKEESP